MFKHENLFEKKTMKKNKITIEYELNCSSEKVVWPLISTAAGMAKWIADEVNADGDTLTFTWGEVWSNHEVRCAVITEIKNNISIRLRWENEADTDEYWEMKIEKGDITDDFTLVITDYAYPEDLDSLKDIWDANFERLHAFAGI